MRLVFGRRKYDDWVQGEFEVVSIQILDVESGITTMKVSGRLCTGDTFGALVTTTHTVGVDRTEPQPGMRVPARWRRDKPATHHIEWGRRHGAWATAAITEHHRRARALGIDPATLDPNLSVPASMKPLDAVMFWSTNAAPLPDGTVPVQVGEADDLKRHGEAAHARIVAVDYLKFWPGTTPPRGASVANVAVQVTRADGATYRALARFGFRTRQRREQIGYVGAVVPVRVDVNLPHRLTLDTDRLPPLDKQ